MTLSEQARDPRQNDEPTDIEALLDFLRGNTRKSIVRADRRLLELAAGMEAAIRV